jgi:hypothetical protein
VATQANLPSRANSIRTKPPESLVRVIFSQIATRMPNIYTCTSITTNVLHPTPLCLVYLAILLVNLREGGGLTTT